MNEIVLTFNEFAHLCSRVTPFFKNSDLIATVTKEALALTEIPMDSVIEVESTAKTIYAAIDEFWDVLSSKPDYESAAQRRGIYLAKSEDELIEVQMGILKNIVNDDSFENMMAIRKMAELSF
jgi:hypothetical protein